MPRFALPTRATLPRRPGTVRASAGMLAVYAAFGCTSGASPAGPREAPTSATTQDVAPIRTDSTTYSLGRNPTYLSVRMRASYTNAGTQTVFLGRCGPRQVYGMLEKQTSAGWVPALRPSCPLIAAPRVPVGPGQTYTDSVTLTAVRPTSGGTPDSASPSFQVDPIDGTYRLVFAVYTTADLGATAAQESAQLAPLAQRVSNPFTLAVPRAF